MKAIIILILAILLSACGTVKTTSKITEYAEELTITNDRGEVVYKGPFRRVTLQRGVYNVVSVASEKQVRQIKVR
jgi:hypothetical protein